MESGSHVRKRFQDVLLGGAATVAILVAQPVEAQQDTLPRDTTRQDTAGVQPDTAGIRQDTAGIQQDTTQDAQRRVAERDLDTALEGWMYTPLYESGWRGGELLDQPVRSEDGDEIGTVENVLLNRDGEITALIAEVGEDWDMGATYVTIPWYEVERMDEGVQTPVTQENLEDYSLFQEEFFRRADVGSLETTDEELGAEVDLWKMTHLLDDYAVLEDGEGYGYVDDLIFDEQGMLQAVVVSATGDIAESGLYAYPWLGSGYAGYAWDPRLDYYVLPFDEQGMTGLQPFDYDRLGDA